MRYLHSPLSSRYHQHYCVPGGSQTQKLSGWEEKGRPRPGIPPGREKAYSCYFCCYASRCPPPCLYRVRGCSKCLRSICCCRPQQIVRLIKSTAVNSAVECVLSSKNTWTQRREIPKQSDCRVTPELVPTVHVASLVSIITIGTRVYRKYANISLWLCSWP